jgi:hypothetical protein
VDLSVSGGNLLLHVRGADKLWAFNSSASPALTRLATTPEMLRKERPNCKFGQRNKEMKAVVRV